MRSRERHNCLWHHSLATLLRFRKRGLGDLCCDSDRVPVRVHSMGYLGIALAVLVPSSAGSDHTPFYCALALLGLSADSRRNSTHVCLICKDLVILNHSIRTSSSTRLLFTQAARRTIEGRPTAMTSVFELGLIPSRLMRGV